MSDDQSRACVMNNAKVTRQQTFINERLQD
jgi:hypothetical protein